MYRNQRKKNSGLKFGEFLKKEKNCWKNQQPKAVKRLVKFENLEEKMSKWTGFFCLFSADLWKFERKKLKN